MSERLIFVCLTMVFYPSPGIKDRVLSSGLSLAKVLGSATLPFITDTGHRPLFPSVPHICRPPKPPPNPHLGCELCLLVPMAAPPLLLRWPQFLILYLGSLGWKGSESSVPSREIEWFILGDGAGWGERDGNHTSPSCVHCLINFSFMFYYLCSSHY